jgi:predicted nucleic acid-binding protein
VPDEYVVDTDVISYLFRYDSRAKQFRPHLTGASLAISFMTVAELDRWALRRGWGQARQDRMATFLQQYSIIMADRQLCRIWARVSDHARQLGRPIEVTDAWIAATALVPDVPLLTNNRGDLLGVPGLRILPDATP